MDAILFLTANRKWISESVPFGLCTWFRYYYYHCYHRLLYAMYGCTVQRTTLAPKNLYVMFLILLSFNTEHTDIWAVWVCVCVSWCTRASCFICGHILLIIQRRIKRDFLFAYYIIKHSSHLFVPSARNVELLDGEYTWIQWLLAMPPPCLYLSMFSCDYKVFAQGNSNLAAYTSSIRVAAVDWCE